MQNTCYVHSQTSDDSEIAFVMRSERFIPEWNRALREVVGEDNVHQLQVCGGKTAWAVPWKSLSEAITLTKTYFDSIIPERESILGFVPFTVSQLNELGVLLEGDERSDSDDPRWMWVRPGGATGEFYSAPMRVVEVGEGPQGTEVVLEGSTGRCTLPIPQDAAKAFGGRLYEWVTVMIREPKKGEISGD